MHTRNVNVRTAAQESTGRCDSGLTVAQFTEVFCWVMAATDGELQPAIFTPPEGSHGLPAARRVLPGLHLDMGFKWLASGHRYPAGQFLSHTESIQN